MKKGKLIIILLGVFFFGASSIFGQNGFKKKYEQKFKVNESTTLKLVNKYGDMDVKNWSENAVEIKVTITVKTSNESKAEKVFKKIDIDFSESGDIVSAITSLNDGINNTSFSIDYDVKVPKYINADISNKYGNLFLEEINGHANVAVKYGNFTINKLGRGKEKPTNQISVAYSNGYCNIADCNWLKLQVAYAKVSIESASALIVGSKYSALKIEKCKSIVTESKYDHPFKVGVVKNFVCTGAYSDFEIGKLYNMLEADIKYANLEVDEVDSDFEEVKIKLRYGKAALNIPENPGYELKAESAYGSIHYPHNKGINRVVDQTESSIWGVVGNSQNPKAKVNIDSKYGSVDIDN